jgi:hypothetical protein
MINLALNLDLLIDQMKYKVIDHEDRFPIVELLMNQYQFEYYYLIIAIAIDALLDHIFHLSKNLIRMFRF